ncbi:hypothetical protein EK21DRAFT_118908 [Setomelanomma holmii]|uniref:Uncharacterized protein n=1 Tax=Setomelanomma holmii TaxID=210430 RepID=A0A9P4GY68_9PLEO|nr:hypothetical protein EK21DRAFT_118908 [Setomelanomma holmii]
MSLGTIINARLIYVNVFITYGLVIGVYVMLFGLVALFPNHHEPAHRSYGTDDISAEECRQLISVDPMGAQVLSSPTSKADDNGQLSTEDTKGHESVLYRVLLCAATGDLYFSTKLVVLTVCHPFIRQVIMLFFGSTLVMSISMTVTQWASSTFHSSLANVEQTAAMEQVILAVTLLALPLLTNYVLRLGLHTQETVHIHIIVASLLASLSGVLVIGVAPSLAIYAVGVAIAPAGMGLSDALRSFATSGSSKKDATQRFYISIRTIQTLAAVVGTPLWSGLFLWMLSNPDIPRGLLYLSNAGVLLVCFLLTRSLQHSGTPASMRRAAI